MFLAIKRNATTDDLRQYLTTKCIKKETIDELVAMYRLNQEELKAKTMTFAPFTVPHITNVNWSLLSDVRSSGLVKPGELTYKIQLEGVVPYAVGNSATNITFHCSPEELQAFINKLKEIERHCQRVGSAK